MSGEHGWEGAVPGRPSRLPWVLLVLVVAGGVVLIGRLGGGGGSLVVQEAPTATTSAIVSPAPAARPTGLVGRWQHMPPSPLAAREGPASAWTGRELIIWGGARYEGLGTTSVSVPYADGAAYDPETGRWRGLAPAPLEARAGAAAVWTGRELLVVGGFTSEPITAATDGAAYDPVEDSWRPIAPLPQPGEPAGAVWTGRELVLVVADVSDQYEIVEPLGYRWLAFDPTANRWRDLPRPPAPTGVPIRTCATTSGVVLVQQDTLGHHTVRRLDPSGDGWHELPSLRLLGDLRALFTCSDTALLAVTSGERGDRALTMDVADRAWRHLPTLPDGGGETRPSHAVWTGGQWLVTGSGPGALYTPTGRIWQQIRSFERGLRSGATVAWTGRELLLWGGADNGNLRADGLVLRLEG